MMKGIKRRLTQLFIPCEENGYRPDFLEQVSIGFILVLILFTFAIANLESLLWMSSKWMVSTILPAVIVEKTNDERVEGSLSTLTRSDVLDRAAQLKAEDMATYGYFSHYSPSGVSPWYWFDEAGYVFIHAGENLAVHFTDSDAVVDAWMASPGHRANIMNGDFKEIGIGTAPGIYKGFPTVFVVQLFGTQAVQPAHFNVNAVSEDEIPNVQALRSTSTVALSILERDTVTTPQVANASIHTDSGTLNAESPTQMEERTHGKSVKVGNEATLPKNGVQPEREEKNAFSSESDEMSARPESEYSDLATISRVSVLAGISTPKPPATSNTHAPLLSLLTRPAFWLQVVYGVLGSLVFMALLLSIIIEWKRQHPVQIAYGVGLILVMIILLRVHLALTSGVAIV